MNHRNPLCEECGIPDDFELPAPLRTIHHGEALAIEAAQQPDAERTAALPLMDAPYMHGEWIGTQRYCVPCGAERDAEHHPDRCEECGSAWEKPTTQTTDTP